MARFGRRQFLEESFFTAALSSMAAAGLFELPASAAPRPRRVGPGDRLRIGVIGVRSRGSNHVDGYLGLPDAEVVAICDIDRGVGEKVVAGIENKTGKRPAYYQDLRRMLERSDIDAVSMALPIHWHTLASLWAMESGKHVYVEKPVSHNVSEGRRLVEGAQRYNKVCQAGTQSRSSPAVRGAIAHVHAGKIGKVTLARGLCYKIRNSIGVQPDAPVPEGVDFDLWLGPAPRRPFNPNTFHYNWHWRWDTGAGDLGNQGIHQMDIARWALNQDRLADAVLSVGGRLGYVDQGETPNTMVSAYDYGDSTLLFEVRGLKCDGLSAAGTMPGVTIGDIVYGSDGYVVITSDYGKAAAFDKAGNPTETFRGDGNHFANFVAAAKAGNPAACNAPVREGHLSSALCHLGNISYKLGKVGPVAKADFGAPGMTETYSRMLQHLSASGVDLNATSLHWGKALKLNPQSERFLNDRAADALLTRDYRKGFVVPKKV